MQHAPQELFCDECGLANEATASHCVSCQHPLAQIRSALPVAPVVVTPPPVLAVTPGNPLTLDGEERGLLSSQYSTCDFQRGSILAGHYYIQIELLHILFTGSFW